MVKSPISVEAWHPIAHARQLMLTHSFSFLPILHANKWNLLSELGIVNYLHSRKESRAGTMAKSVADAVADGLKLIRATTVTPNDSVATLLKSTTVSPNPTLWLVLEKDNHLVGVLSPFELM